MGTCLQAEFPHEGIITTWPQFSGWYNDHGLCEGGGGYGPPVDTQQGAAIGSSGGDDQSDLLVFMKIYHT